MGTTRYVNGPVRHTQRQDGVEALDLAENSFGPRHPSGIGSVRGGPVSTDDLFDLFVNSILKQNQKRCLENFAKVTKKPRPPPMNSADECQ